MQQELRLTPEGYIPEGVELASKAAFVALLERWLRESEELTIGEPSTYGRRAHIRLRLGDHVVVLNADTKRAAVEEFIQDAGRRGGAARWQVVANRGGTVNKVNFREDGGGTPGWYAYLTEPVRSGTEI